jgi:hypothetical protein
MEGMWQLIGSTDEGTGKLGHLHHAIDADPTRLLGAIEPPGGDTAADARRIRVLAYVRAHLTDPGLTHDHVAAAHHMAPRTLHRLSRTKLTPSPSTSACGASRRPIARRALAKPSA